MWHMLMVASMATVAGIYSTMRAPSEMVGVTSGLESMRLAESMAIYRTAVQSCFTEKKPLLGNVFEQLGISTNTQFDCEKDKIKGHIPAYAKHIREHFDDLPWDYYRDQDGYIYVYSVTPLPHDFVAQLMRTSRNSLFVGIYRSNKPYLQWNDTRDSKFAVPQELKEKKIADGSPVWVSGAVVERNPNKPNKSDRDGDKDNYGSNGGGNNPRGNGGSGVGPRSVTNASGEGNRGNDGAQTRWNIPWQTPSQKHPHASTFFEAASTRDQANDEACKGRELREDHDDLECRDHKDSAPTDR